MMTRVLRIGVRICSLVMMLGMRLDVSGKKAVHISNLEMPISKPQKLHPTRNRLAADSQQTAHDYKVALQFTVPLTNKLGRELIGRV